MFTRAFLRDLTERVIATFCQALAALLIASGTGLLDTSWGTALSLAGMTALVSLLKGVAAGSIDTDTGASLLTSPPPRVDDETGAVRWTPVLVALVLLAAVLLVVLLGGCR